MKRKAAYEKGKVSMMKPRLFVILGYRKSEEQAFIIFVYR